MVTTLTILTVATTVLPKSNTAMADDGDQLYCIVGGYTKLRPYAGTGKVTDISTATVGYNNSVSPTAYAEIDGAWKPINPITCTVFDRPGYPTPNDNEWNGKDFDSSDSHFAGGYGGGTSDRRHNVGIDNDGRLWFQDRDTKGNESWSHTADTYRFSHIASTLYGNDNDAGTNETSIPKLDGTLLLGHRISNTTQATQVMQMPTTGAPEGLTTFGLAAVVLGLAGLVFALVRRRD